MARQFVEIDGLPDTFSVPAPYAFARTLRRARSPRSGPVARLAMAHVRADGREETADRLEPERFGALCGREQEDLPRIILSVLAGDCVSAACPVSGHSPPGANAKIGVADMWILCVGGLQAIGGCRKWARAMPRFLHLAIIAMSPPPHRRNRTLEPPLVSSCLEMQVALPSRPKRHVMWRSKILN